MYRQQRTSCIGFTDSDYAGDKNNRRSTSGYVFTLCGGAISWKSRQQTSVALSTTEAEYVAATEACKELIWLNRLLQDLSIPAFKSQCPQFFILTMKRHYHWIAMLLIIVGPNTLTSDIILSEEVAAGTINLQSIGILQISVQRPYRARNGRFYTFLVFLTFSFFPYQYSLSSLPTKVFMVFNEAGCNILHVGSYVLWLLYWLLYLLRYCLFFISLEVRSCIYQFKNGMQNEGECWTL